MLPKMSRSSAGIACASSTVKEAIQLISQTTNDRLCVSAPEANAAGTPRRLPGPNRFHARLQLHQEARLSQLLQKQLLRLLQRQEEPQQLKEQRPLLPPLQLRPPPRN